jgi:hypothetical protein
MTEQLIEKKAGVGQGRRVAVRSWLRTLADIRGLPVSSGHIY